jgi:hypothetical protein
MIVSKFDVTSSVFSDTFSKACSVDWSEDENKITFGIPNTNKCYKDLLLVALDTRSKINFVIDIYTQIKIKHVLVQQYNIGALPLRVYRDSLLQNSDKESLLHISFKIVSSEVSLLND